MTNTQENTKVDVSNEPVTITRGQLDGIMTELANLKKGTIYQKPKRVTERIVLARFHDDKIVTWMGNVDELRNKETGKLVAWTDIKVHGSDKPVRIEYLKFLNSSNAFQAKIISQKMEEIVESQGQIRTSNPDEANISGKMKNFKSAEIDAEVVRREYTVTVEVTEGPHKGETYTVPASCLNL